MSDLTSTYQISSLLEGVCQEWGKFNYLPKFHGFYFKPETVFHSVSGSLKNLNQASGLFQAMKPEARSEISDNVLRHLDNLRNVYEKLSEDYPAVKEIKVLPALDSIKHSI